MTRRLALATAALLLAAPAFAAERQKPADCPASLRDKPTLDVKKLPSARFRMVTEPIGWEREPSGEQVRLTLRHGVETADLAAGVRLRIVQGGCETYSNAYEFTLPPALDAGPDGGLWLKRASALLRDLAPKSRDPLVPLTRLSDALARDANDPSLARAVMNGGLEGQLGAGELAPSYSVAVDRVGGHRVLTVVYFIPL